MTLWETRPPDTIKIAVMIALLIILMVVGY